ncbi:MAG TPA: TOBE domain-containing protein, partial [Alphaproteobacteria bacterium]
EDVSIVDGAGGPNVLEGEVRTAMFMGDSKEFRIALKDSALRLRLHPSIEIDEGQKINVSLPADRCRALLG